MISKMNKDKVFDELNKYTLAYDMEFNEIINKDIEYTKSILNIEREQDKPRKDYACWSDVRPSIWYMFDSLYKPTSYEWKNITDASEIKNILDTYINNYYDESDDKDTWFNKVKELTEELGYCSNMKEYKKNPEAYKGNVSDISTVLRVALTSKSQTPDLYEIMHILGKDKIINRYKDISF
jgi:glutamyl-tRNA synthetase